MLRIWLAALLLALQETPEKFPAQDHAWLRFKPGTFIKNHVKVERAGNLVETTQKQLLKEKGADDYLIEVTESLVQGTDLPSRSNRTTNGVFVGKETLTIGGKEYPCRISLSKGAREGGEMEYRYWIPEGNKAALKVVFKQPGMEGELIAIDLNQKVTIEKREYSCAKLQGTIKRGTLNGTMTLLTTQEIPGAQAYLEMSLQDPNAVTKITVTPVEIHEEK